jgi:histidyl-tRNA synthetase
MSLADRLGAAYTVILGDRELETGKAMLRRMATGDQQEVALSLLPMVLAGL